MDTRGSRLLGNACNQLLDLLTHDHHHVCEFVDHHHDARQLFKRRMHLLFLGQLKDGVRFPHGIWNGITTLFGVQHFPVVTLQVPNAEKRHELVATFHLGNAPAQTVGRILHVGNDRREQMWDAVIN